MSYFKEEHNLFRESLREFLEREVRPNINAWEKEGRIPKSIWKKMGDQGFLGLTYPEKYGGFDLDFFFEVHNLFHNSSAVFACFRNSCSSIDMFFNIFLTYLTSLILYLTLTNSANDKLSFLLIKINLNSLEKPYRGRMAAIT